MGLSEILTTNESSPETEPRFNDDKAGMARSGRTAPSDEPGSLGT